MTRLKINSKTLGHYTVPAAAKRGVCIDIGANVGNFFTKHNNFRLVHAYEPLLVCFNECVKKATGKHHIHVFQQALAARPGLVRMMRHRTGFAGSSSVKGAAYRVHDWKQTIGLASAVDLRTAIARTGASAIDYLKVDCECSEHAILCGQDLSGVKHIGIEIHCQLGQKKYDELVTWIERTHVWDRAPRWRSRGHNERLATRKDLL